MRPLPAPRPMRGDVLSLRGSCISTINVGIGIIGNAQRGEQKIAQYAAYRLHNANVTSKGSPCMGEEVEDTTNFANMQIFGLKNSYAMYGAKVNKHR